MPQLDRYLFGRPQPSWRLAILIGALSVPLLYLSVLIAAIPVQKNRLLGDPLFSESDNWLWYAAAANAALGIGALVLTWGCWRQRPWIKALPVPRVVWLALAGTMVFRLLGQLFA